MKKMFSLLAVLLCVGFTYASAQQDLDARWLPWVGAWRPVGDFSSAAGQKSPPLILVVPNPDGESVRITRAGSDGGAEDVLKPNGVREPVSRTGCAGSREMRWSSDGTRLFSHSDLTCDGVPRTSSGIMLIDRNRYWIDIQVVETGQHPGIWIQKYRPVGSLPPEVLPAPQATSLAVSANLQRTRVSRLALDADDVIEALEQVGSDAVEAMLVETNARFAMNSKLLTRLAAANVPDRVMDVMVALSFPDRFVVEKGAVSRLQPGAGTIAPPMIPWDLYSLYYGFPFWYSAYPYARVGLFDPWYGGFCQYYPYRTDGSNQVSNGESRRGVVIAGSGYTRVSARSPDSRAHPRYGRGDSGVVHASRSDDSSSSSSSSSSSGGSSSSGSSSGGSVSSSGYTSGGSSGGGTAHPRP